MINYTLEASLLILSILLLVITLKTTDHQSLVVGMLTVIVVLTGIGLLVKLSTVSNG
jgi:hypothetical protein